MTLEHLIVTYGYAAILIGTFIEGETVLVLGGIASKLGYLDLLWVIVCAFIGTLIGDQLAFFVGYYHGTAFLHRHPSWNKRANKASRLLKRYGTIVILGFRFMYGLRIVTPFLIGMSHFPVIKFVILNMISAAVWAIAVGILGYAFGHGLELVLGNIRRYEIKIVASVLLAGIVIWLIHFVYVKRQQKPNR